MSQVFRLITQEENEAIHNMNDREL